MRKKKNFTLTEIMIVLIIVGILATFAVPGYRNLTERNKAYVCEINLKTLLEAVEIYGFENDALPADLSYLRDEDIRRAWVRVRDRKGAWRTNFAYFIINLNRGNVAFAQSYWQEALSLRCPAADPDAAHTYGLNSAVADLSWDDYADLDDDQEVIADSDTPTFPAVAARHKRYRPGGVIKYSLSIGKSGNISSQDTAGSGGGGCRQ